MIRSSWVGTLSRKRVKQRVQIRSIRQASGVSQQNPCPPKECRTCLRQGAQLSHTSRLMVYSRVRESLRGSSRHCDSARHPSHPVIDAGQSGPLLRRRIHVLAGCCQSDALAFRSVSMCSLHSNQLSRTARHAICNTRRRFQALVQQFVTRCHIRAT